MGLGLEYKCHPVEIGFHGMGNKIYCLEIASYIGSLDGYKLCKALTHSHLQYELTRIFLWEYLLGLLREMGVRHQQDQQEIDLQIHPVESGAWKINM